MSGSRYTPAHRPPASLDFPAFWCAFAGGKLLVKRNADGPSLPELHPEDLSVEPGASHYLGTLDGRHCFATALQNEADLPAGTELLGLRALFLEADTMFAAVAGRAFQILEWERTHRYCGSCGAATLGHIADRARECPACKLVFYPRISPVVMALVTRGRELLLTRKPGYAKGRYTVVAGFVEAGETLEHALAREVLEETHVHAGNPLYFASQAWPFPNSLVMAFALEYLSGEARGDGVELEEARWFDIDALPELPEPVHVSRQLIDATVARLRKQQTVGGR